MGTPGHGILPYPSSSDKSERHKPKLKNKRSSNPLRAFTSEALLAESTSATPSIPTIKESSSNPNSRPPLKPRTSSAPIIPMNRSGSSVDEIDTPSTYMHRDSIISIQDDPFFNNYQTPQSVSLSRELWTTSDSPSWVNMKPNSLSTSKQYVCPAITIPII